MKKLFLFLSILLAITFSQAQGIWNQIPDMDYTVWGAGGFSIGTKGYVIMGWGGSLGGNISRDVYEFDSKTNVWTKKTNFPSTGRYGFSSFSIGDKGYIVGGNTGGSWLSGQVWEYDPTNDSWTLKNKFPGLNRGSSASFIINNKAYLLTGTDSVSNMIKDVWEYDPSIDSWSKKSDFPTGKRIEASGYSIGDKGYVVGGDSIGGLTGLSKCLWEYDPILDIWTRKKDFPGNLRTRTCSFSIGDKGFIALGNSPGTIYRRDLWEYNPSTNNWTQKTQFPGMGRSYAASFVIGPKAYIGTGVGTLSFLDFYEYIPCPGNITGQVTYSGGPVLNGYALLYEYATGKHMKKIDSVEVSFGNYTFQNVQPGLYIILASPNGTLPQVSGTYYGDVNNWGGATKVGVACGTNVNANINLTELNPTAGLATVSGKILQGINYSNGKVMAPGDPVRGVDVGIKKKPLGQTMSIVQTDANGDFDIGNVEPGDYTMYVDIPGLPVVSTFDVSITSNETIVNRNFFADSAKIYIDSLFLNGISGGKQNSFTVSLNPNPANKEVSCAVFVNNAANVFMYVRDITGKLVLSKSASLHAGNNNIQLNIESLPQGVYSVETQLPDERVFKKLVVE